MMVMEKQPLHVVILAAGVGSRMRSDRLKVLHEVAGVAMIEHVLRLAKSLNPQQITMVYGHQGEQLQAHLKGERLNWAEQRQQLGTGHAVLQAEQFFQADEKVLVLYGDAPLVQRRDLSDLSASQFVLTAVLENPFGYGRIVRRQDKVVAIVEQKDADAQQQQIREINSGIIQAPAKQLKKWLAQLSNDNQQGEYYLTDVIALAERDGCPFTAVQLADENSVKGANDMLQLAELDAIFQQRKRLELQQSGVRLINPSSIQLRADICCGKDVVIDQGVVLEGKINLQDGVKIGAYSCLRDVELASGTSVESHSVLHGVKTSGACGIGPFARLRPGTELAADCKVGNFVETKACVMGEGSKASHLSYLGDAKIGSDVNIGAGTITCNYDGVNKSQTLIEDGAFIGSNSQLVAPVTIGSKATIGAGSTIVFDAPANQLTLARAKQLSISDWQRPVKKSEE